MARKQNPEQRRKDLCDAAISLLAEDGLKGVSHLKVDRKAGVPDGSTSFYFRTSAALLCAVATRVADLDLVDLTAATKSAATDSGVDGAAHGLAALVIRSGRGSRLVRTKARLELAMPSSRDPGLAAAFFQHQQRFFELHRDVVLRLSPAGTDPALINQQATVLMMFIGGVLQATARGDRTITSIAQLEGIIVAIVNGMSVSAREPHRGKQNRSVTARTSSRR